MVMKQSLALTVGEVVIIIELFETVIKLHLLSSNSQLKFVDIHIDDIITVS